MLEVGGWWFVVGGRRLEVGDWQQGAAEAERESRDTHGVGVEMVGGGRWEFRSFSQSLPLWTES
jgi:hypothetical protein